MGKCNPITRILPAFCAWVLLLAATGLFFAFPCIHLMYTYTIAVPIVQSIITFFVLINFALATFVNPGVIPKAEPDEIKPGEASPPPYKDIIIKDIRVRMKWCVTCQFYRPPRCVHCGVCDTCIETFDHHCPWVNNCIGRRNYRYFFMFLLWLSIHMVSIFALCTFYLKDHMKTMNQLPTVMTIVILVIIIIVFFPICGLTAYHMMLITQGRTTNEQVTGKFSKGRSPYNKGCCQNILRSLCASPFPRYEASLNSYSSPNHFSARRMSDQQALKESSSLGKTNMQFKYNDNQDYMLPRQSLSEDCEEAPPTYLNRSRLHLSLSESIYTRPEQQTKYNKNSRALTPPVPMRFDCSRRSLPPHNRMYAPSPHYVVAQSVHGTSFVNTRDGPKTGPCTSTQSSHPTMYYPYYQDAALVKYDYGKSVGDVTNFYPVLYKRKDGFSKSDNIPFTSPDGNTVNRIMVTDTCCLGNQTVDKLQEIANRTMIPHQCTDMETAFLPKGCGSFHNSPSKDTTGQLLIAPQQLLINNCVDCQQHAGGSSSHSCQSSVSGDFARTPGNRPLSFVRAMEMSEASIPLNWAEKAQQASRSKGSPGSQSSYKMLSQSPEKKSEHSYEISV